MRTWALALTVLLTGSCIGTGSPEGPEQPVGRASGQISVMISGDPAEVAVYREVVAAFEEAEPDIDVELVEAAQPQSALPQDMLTRLSTSFAGGTPPDAFLLNYRYIGQYASRGVLEPVEPRLEASEVFGPEDFYQPALDAFTFDGVRTCLPQNISSLVVYYNKDLFRERGLAEPRPDWTWFDMVGLARNLTIDRDGDGRTDQWGLGVASLIIRLAPFLWSNGAELVDDEEHPTRFALETPAAIEVMQAFFDLRERHGVIPTERQVEARDDETRFLDGGSAMYIDSRRATPSMRTIEDFDWDVAPLPRFVEPANVLHSDAYCMTRDSENKEATWRFIEFALGPEGAPITAASGRTVPSLIEVASSDVFLDPTQKPANSRVFLDTIDHIRQLPILSTWPEIEDLTDEILELGTYHQIPALDIAQRLIRETAPMFARAR